MKDLLQGIIGRLTPRPLDPQIERLVQRAIDLIDPRLKSFGNYPRAYIPAITAASNYAESLCEKVPRCIELRPSRYAQEPLLHALFRDVESIYATVRESLVIKEYCLAKGKPEGGEVYALMGMRRHEKTVYGPDINGEMVQQDVRKTMVYFDSHTLTLPSATRQEFREKLKTDLFDSLVKSLAEAIGEGVHRRQELESRRDMLASRLRSNPQQAALQEELAQLRQQLGELGKDYELVNYHKLFDSFMAEPQQHLQLLRDEIPIDMRGVMRDSHDRLAGRFEFADLVGRDRRRWTLCPVRMPVIELQEAMHCGVVSSKERWLEI